MPLSAPVIDPPIPSLAEDEGVAQPAIPALALLSTVVIAAVVAGGLGPLWIRVVFRPLHLATLNGLSAGFVALVASIAFHEFGHFAAAWWLAFDVTGVSLGPFRISRLHRRWTLQLIWRRFFLGSVTAVPKSQLNWRKNMLIVVTAGPVATLVFAAASFLLIASGRPAFSTGFWQAALQINSVLTLLCLVPGPAKANQVSDARLFLMLWRFDAAARAVLLYQVLTSVRIEGRRPREFPEWIIRRMAVAEARPAMRVAFAHAIADWALDRGDFDTASAWNKHLGAVAANCDPELCYSALAHSACLDTVFHHDLASAGTKLRRVPMRMVAPKWLRHRSIAVFDLVNRDSGGALANLILAEFYRPAVRLPYFEYEEFLVQVLRQIARDLARLPEHSPHVFHQLERHE